MDFKATFILLFALFACTGALTPYPRPYPQTLKAPIYQWYRLTPSHNLDFHSCYDHFECARLLVPLDHHDETNKNEIALPVIRLPAAIPREHPQHGGAVILNPGGPGGSGILYALAAAEKVQRLLHSPKQYDILSFDPRGVFLSAPSAYCFDEAVSSETWFREKRAVGSLNASEAALRHHWALEKARGQLCERTENGKFEDGEDIRNYMSTEYVAHDMLRIITALAAEPRSRNQIQPGGQAPLRKPFEPKLQYIGLSYGTFLGHVFATLFPQSVDRMILDGNIDAENWVSRYEASIDDNDAIRDYFFEQCLEAKSACAFWRESDSKYTNIAARYNEVRGKLQYEPAVVAGHGHATAISADELEQGFFTTLYQPLQFFKPFAEFLNALHNDTEPEYPFWTHALPTKDTITDEVLAYEIQNAEASAATHCSDGPDLSDGSVATFKDYLANLTTRFPHAGASQAEFKISCWTWPQSLRTKRRYAGPFGGDVPILFLNNRLDPVTPLKSAKKMAGEFKGSSVLVRDGVGHGAQWPETDCVWNHLKTYMATGELPEDGAECHLDCKPFDGPCRPDSR